MVTSAHPVPAVDVDDGAHQVAGSMTRHPQVLHRSVSLLLKHKTCVYHSQKLLFLFINNSLISLFCKAESICGCCIFEMCKWT